MALDSAARHVASQHSLEAMDATVENLLQALQLDCCSCCEAWQLRHRHQLRGSTAVLKRLETLHNPGLKQLLRDASARTAFLRLMHNLQQRSEQMVAGGKGWQQAAAREAVAACSSLQHSCRSGGLGGSLWTSWAAVTSASALAIVGVAALVSRPQALQVIPSLT